jgi:hypothetical protein
MTSCYSSSSVLHHTSLNATDSDCSHASSPAEPFYDPATSTPPPQARQLCEPRARGGQSSRALRALEGCYRGRGRPLAIVLETGHLPVAGQISRRHDPSTDAKALGVLLARSAPSPDDLELACGLRIEQIVVPPPTPPDLPSSS